MRRVGSIRTNRAIRFSGILLISGSNTVAINTPTMRNTGMMMRMIGPLMGNSGIVIFGVGHHGSCHGGGNRHTRFARMSVGSMVTWG